jgi:hypothetical protein
MSRPPKPIHVFQKVKSLTRSKIYYHLCHLDYWNSNLRTEVKIKDILHIECDCEEMLVTVKSNDFKTYTRKVRKS